MKLNLKKYKKGIVLKSINIFKLFFFKKLKYKFIMINFTNDDIVKLINECNKLRKKEIKYGIIIEDISLKNKYEIVLDILKTDYPIFYKISHNKYISLNRKNNEFIYLTDKKYLNKISLKIGMIFDNKIIYKNVYCLCDKC